MIQFVKRGKDTSDATAAASDILTGKSAYISTGKVDGSMQNNGALSYNPSTSQQSIPAGYTSGGRINAVTSDIDNNIDAGNIKKDVTILGVTGTYEAAGDATSDATLQAKHLLQGYSAVVNGTVIQGTMIDRGTVTITATSNDIAIPEGHYNSLSIPIINAANCEDYTECSQALAAI